MIVSTEYSIETIVSLKFMGIYSGGIQLMINREKFSWTKTRLLEISCSIIESYEM